MNKRKLLYRLTSIMAGLVFLFAVGYVGNFSMAQDAEEPTEEVAEEVAAEEEAVVEEAPAEEAITAETVQTNLDQIWLLLAGFLVFFMQAGFAMLEGGMIRRTGVVNSMAENFMDACVTGIVFFLVGYGIAYAGGESAYFNMPEIALGGIIGTGAEDGLKFIDFFFQFAFAGAAATIATGAMAERTNFIGKLIYSAILGAFLYPIVVFWTWGGGWISQAGFLDFAGSTIVHQVGGVIALTGAAIVGPRAGWKAGESTAPSNLAIAALGTFILWFGWYGFNVGSTLAASNPNQLGLVVVNTTLAAAAGAIGAMFFQYFRIGKWDLSMILNGSLAGLVGITAGCAFVTPFASIIIGLVAGIVVVITIGIVSSAGIDDAVGAFAVHGACGMLGSLAIGFWGVAELTGSSAGLFMGGGVDLLISQIIGVVAVAVWAAVTGIIMFTALNAAGVLRMHEHGDIHGIDQYEHGAEAYVLMELPESPGD